MHSILFRCFGLLLVLGSLSCLEAAPSKNKEVGQPKAEQLVRVYPIDEEQYERLLKLTNGKHVISEGRLTSAGFSSVRNTLDSGWNSLLRIMGLTTTSRSEVSKIDIDGQPLCVMQRSFPDGESGPRSLEARAANEDDSIINCIVVLKRGESELESLMATNPDFAPYWYHENIAPVAQQQSQQTPQQLTQQAVELAIQAEEQASAPEENEKQEHEVRQLTTTTTTTTVAPKVTKMKLKKPNNTKSKSKSKNSRRTSGDAASSRQYSSPYAPPAPYRSDFGSPFGGSYPYGGYESFGPYSPYGQQPSFGPQFPYAPQPQYYPEQYYGTSPSYSYFGDTDDEDEDEEEEYAEEAAAATYGEDYDD